MEAVKWRCTVCKKVFEGEKPPVPCPVCGAGESAFERVEEKKIYQWRCSICKKVFEGERPPVPCPVCGAGESAFSIVEDEKPLFRRDTDESFVLIGGGTASFECAKAIRERNKSASITMICGERVAPYIRPSLSDMIGSGLPFDSILLEKDEFYRSMNITPVFDRADSFDPAEKTVTLEGGQVLSYDKLLLATGANCFNPLPSVPGSLPLFTLRDYADAKAIMEHAKPGGNAVVLGGGILGIEAAFALRERGLSVTVVELSPRVMAAQADDKASQLLAERLREAGIGLYLSCSVRETAPNGVSLSCGDFIEASLLLVSAGIRSEVALARQAGLTVERGVTVDGRMRTSHADIFAAGDCAELPGQPGGLWPIASAQGAVAGANMCGDESLFTAFIPATILEADGIALFSAGSLQNPEAVLTYHDTVKGSYQCLALSEGRLKGGLLYGNTDASGKLMTALTARAPLAQAVRLLG